MPNTPVSAELAAATARGDRPDAENVVGAHDGDLVVQVRHGAAVIGHDAHTLAEDRPALAVRKIEHAVLLVQPRDNRLRILSQQAKAIASRQRITRQGF